MLWGGCSSFLRSLGSTEKTHLHRQNQNWVRHWFPNKRWGFSKSRKRQWKLAQHFHSAQNKTYFHHRTGISLRERPSAQALSCQAGLSSHSLHSHALLVGWPQGHACTSCSRDAAACTVQAALPPCPCRIRMHKETVIIIMTGHNFFSTSYSAVIWAVLFP